MLLCFFCEILIFLESRSCGCKRVGNRHSVVYVAVIYVFCVFPLIVFLSEPCCSHDTAHRFSRTSFAQQETQSTAYFPQTPHDSLSNTIKILDGSGRTCVASGLSRRECGRPKKECGERQPTRPRRGTRRAMCLWLLPPNLQSQTTCTTPRQPQSKQRSPLHPTAVYPRSNMRTSHLNPGNSRR